MGLTSIKGTNIEICGDWSQEYNIKHAILDFDGTISMLRDGWQDVMVPMMVEKLVDTPVEKDNIEKLIERGLTKEDATRKVEKDIVAVVIDYIERLTGKQTIYQMFQFAEELKKRGAIPLDALEYKKEYYVRLNPIVDERKERLARGELTQEDLRVPMAKIFLEELLKRNIVLYLASGTDENYVLAEAETVGLAELFTGGIWGARDDYKSFSKAKAIQLVIKKNQLEPHEIMIIGDGVVEIENMRAAGGLAIGVYTEEGNHYDMNKRKKERLIDAGANLVMSNFDNYKELLEFLFWR